MFGNFQGILIVFKDRPLNLKNGKLATAVTKFEFSQF